MINIRLRKKMNTARKDSAIKSSRAGKKEQIKNALFVQTAQSVR